MQYRFSILPFFFTVIFGCGPSINTQVAEKLSTDPRKILIVYFEPKDSYWSDGTLRRTSSKKRVIELYNSTPELKSVFELKQVKTISTLVGDLVGNSESDLFRVFASFHSKYRAVYYIYDRDESFEPTLTFGAKPYFPCSENRYVELLQERSDYVGGFVLKSNAIPEIKTAYAEQLLSVIMEQVSEGKYDLKQAFSYANDEIREHLSNGHFSDRLSSESLESAIKTAIRYKSLNDSSYIWLFKSVSSDIARLRNTEDVKFLQSFLQSSFPEPKLQEKLTSQIRTKLDSLTTIEQTRLTASSFSRIRLTTNLKSEAKATAVEFVESLNERIRKRIAAGVDLLFVPSRIEIEEQNANLVQIHIIGNVDLDELRKSLAEVRQTNPLNPSDWNAAVETRFTLTEEAFDYISSLEFDGSLNFYKVTVTERGTDDSIVFNAFKNRTRGSVELLKDMILDAVQGNYLVDVYGDRIALQVISHAHYIPKKGKQEIVYDILQTLNSGNQQIHYLRHTSPRTTLIGKKSPEDKFMDFFSFNSSK